LGASSVRRAALSAQADSFFARKTITISIGYTAGGSYDLYGRLVARHIGRHIPGQPAVVAQNMPGAGRLKAANYLYEIAPRDGTALGVVVESIALEQARRNTMPRNSPISAGSPPAITLSCSGIRRRCSRLRIRSARDPRSPALARDRSPK